MIVDDSLQESKTFQFSLKAQELRKQGREIISLGLGEPEYDTPEHIKQAAVEALAAGLTRYGAAPGLPELRDAVASKLRHDNGIPATSPQIIIVPGAKNALFVAAASVLRPGDEVINLTPCYVSNVPILKLAEPQCRIVNIPLLRDGFGVDWKRIQKAVNERTRLLVTNYPNNPSGKMLDEKDAFFLRDLVARRDMYWLSDEIYEKLSVCGKKHISPAALDGIVGKVITVNGFSKSYSMTGWRIGYVHAPERISSVMVKIHQQLNTNTAVFIQKAALAALTGPQDRLECYVQELRGRADAFRRFCATTPGARSAPLEGGVFGFLDVACCGMGSDQFCSQLLEQTGVALIPGVAFGKDYDSWVRVSLCAPTTLFEKGLSLIGTFMSAFGNGIT